MSGFSYPPPIFLSSTYNRAFYLSLDPSGFLTYAYAQTLYLSRGDYRLSYITSVTLGQGAAGLVLTLDSSRNVSNINSLTATSITVGSLSGLSSLTVSGAISAGSITGISSLTLLGTLTATTVNATSSIQINGANVNLSQLDRVNLTTLGTCEASKAIVLDASRKCSNIYEMKLDQSGTGLVIPNLKFQVSGVETNFNHSYYLSITEGGCEASKALVVNATKDLSGLRDLSITRTFTAATSVSAPSITCDTITKTGTQTMSATTLNINPTTLQLLGTALTATATQLNKMASVTATATELNYLDLTTGAGTAEASKALVLDSAKDLTGVNSIELNNPTTTGASSLMTDYSLALRRSSDSAAAASGICFASTTLTASAATPGASIIFTRAVAASPAGSLSFYSKTTAGATDTLTECMRIGSDGKINFSSAAGDSDWNMLKYNTNCTLRFGSTSTFTRGCISLTWKNASNSILSNQNNGLQFNMYGTSNAFFISEAGCGINRESPVSSKLHIVADSNNLYGSWKKGLEIWNDNATPMKFGVITYDEAGGTQTNGVSIGTYTNDPINFMINGTNAMLFNTSRRLAVDRVGPEATIHSGGEIWADSNFHCKGNAADKAYYRWNWVQANYPAIGNHVNASTIRIGICNASYVWQGYAPVYGGSYTNGSDRDYKRDIQDIPYGLDTVLQMRPKAFVWKQDDRPGIGFIAQELQPVCHIPVSGDPNRPVNPDTGMPPDGMGIDYASLTAVLCRAIQELAARVEALEQAVVKNA